MPSFSIQMSCHLKWCRYKCSRLIWWWTPRTQPSFLVTLNNCNGMQMIVCPGSSASIQTERNCLNWCWESSKGDHDKSIAITGLKVRLDTQTPTTVVWIWNMGECSTLQGKVPSRYYCGLHLILNGFSLFKGVIPNILESMLGKMFK